MSFWKGVKSELNQKKKKKKIPHKIREPLLFCSVEDLNKIGYVNFANYEWKLSPAQQFQIFLFFFMFAHYNCRWDLLIHHRVLCAVTWKCTRLIGNNVDMMIMRELYNFEAQTERRQREYKLYICLHHGNKHN